MDDETTRTPTTSTRATGDGARLAPGAADATSVANPRRTTL